MKWAPFDPSLHPAGLVESLNSSSPGFLSYILLVFNEPGPLLISASDQWMDGPEIATAPDTKFRTCNHYQLVPMGQKLFVRNHQGKFTELLAGTEYELLVEYQVPWNVFPFVIFASEVTAAGLICFQTILFTVPLYQMGVSCLPALVTPVRSRGAGGLWEGSRDVPPVSTGLSELCPCTASSLVPCCQARLQYHYCQNETWASLAGKCVIRRKILWKQRYSPTTAYLREY